MKKHRRMMGPLGSACQKRFWGDDGFSEPADWQPGKRDGRGEVLAGGFPLAAIPSARAISAAPQYLSALIAGRCLLDFPISGSGSDSQSVSVSTRSQPGSLTPSAYRNFEGRYRLRSRFGWRLATAPIGTLKGSSRKAQGVSPGGDQMAGDQPCKGGAGCIALTGLVS